MALKLTLDQYEFPRLDYGYNVAFKIYDESGTAFDASGLTGTAKFYKRHNDRSTFWRDVARQVTILGQVGTVINDIAVSWTTQASGEGTFAFTAASRPNITGWMLVEIQLTDSTTKRSTELKQVYISPSESSA